MICAEIFFNFLSLFTFISLTIVKCHIRSCLLNFLLFYVTAFGKRFLKEGGLCSLCSLWLHNENFSAEASIKMIFFFVQMKYKTDYV